MIARPATAFPMDASVKGCPLGAMATAPDLRQRSARRRSPVITTVRGAVCSTIQSSAASKASVTILREMRGVAGTRIGLLLTTTTGTDTVSTQFLQEYLKTVSKMLYSGSNPDETS